MLVVCLALSVSAESDPNPADDYHGPGGARLRAVRPVVSVTRKEGHYYDAGHSHGHAPAPAVPVPAAHAAHGHAPAVSVSHKEGHYYDVPEPPPSPPSAGLLVQPIPERKPICHVEYDYVKKTHCEVEHRSVFNTYIR